ncbi:MAG: 16S rRNA (cytidine(1402)-2'-O)-methyltransferase [Gammaproteobacteria bacterium]|nr:16S rRNA (cytidine(1402)-2'-O)-methyltransferase [Gammaproteobacteria bacterium]MCW9005399.1 16S rRNA (cytidine(1402)-2'-O)-methyltransferase [Gammaproteobacteria bacterium]
MSINAGTLFVVATPIGNRADFTERAINVLSDVDLVAAEDTRHSKSLLQFFNIATPLIAYHDHNEEARTPQLIEKLLRGQDIALISDAGTPLVSDPGYRLVKAAHEAGIKVSPIPGACAAVAALSVSGIPTDRYRFEGFPPAKSVARQAYFEKLHKESATLVFYESCHRIRAALEDMAAIFGGQRVAVLAREITKTFETIRKAPLSELLALVSEDENQRKGEFVIIVQGAELDEVEASVIQVDVDRLLEILVDELPVKQASELVAKITGIKKNQLYKKALNMKISN